MKRAFLTRVIAVVAFFALSTTAFAQKGQTDYRWVGEYETQVQGVGQDGTKVFTVIGAKAKKVEDAINLAKRHAVEACLFGGLTGAGYTNETPGIVGKNVDQVIADNQEFFNDFFRMADKKNTAGAYIRFINRSGQPTSTKIKGGYTVTVDVQVAYAKLQQYMEEKGIVKKLGESVVNAMKPTVMVIPSDSYMNKHGFGNEVVIDGKTRFDADYGKAFANDEDLRLVIAELGKIMTQRGFPLKSLESSLKKLDQAKAQQLAADGKYLKKETNLDLIKRTVSPDFVLDLDFTVMKEGSNRFIKFILIGRDAYTDEDQANEAGAGKPSASASAALLLEEAVLNYMDSFCGQLMNYFNDMAENGRKITVELAIADEADLSFEDQFDLNGDEGSLSDIMNFWMTENCIKGSFTRTSGSETKIMYEQVRIPLTMTKTKFGKEFTESVTAESFIENLRKFLRDNFGLESAKIEHGLGGVELIIGG